MEILVIVLLVLLTLVSLAALYGTLRAQARIGLLADRLPDAAIVDSLSKRLQEADESSRKSFERLAGNLGELSKATEQMMKVGENISSLEDLLKPPKLRGGMGETLLEQLLAQILPENYELQYGFKNGQRVDAIIRMGDRMVPVDAKFPLEAFRRLAQAHDEAEAQRERKAFLKAVKVHIDDVARKYILPDEGTYDFALMYIPAENVYYETIIKDDQGEGVLPYAMEKHVIPVSPNSIYAYLQVIVLGLRGLRIEQRTQEIMGMLGRLDGDQKRFRQEFNVLGTHLENARKKYEEADKRLAHFEDKLLEAGGEEPQLGSPIEEPQKEQAT
jgi:DNA recombination protein RmuC